MSTGPLKQPMPVEEVEMHSPTSNNNIGVDADTATGSFADSLIMIIRTIAQVLFPRISQGGEDGEKAKTVALITLVPLAGASVMFCPLERVAREAAALFLDSTRI